MGLLPRRRDARGRGARAERGSAPDEPPVRFQGRQSGAADRGRPDHHRDSHHAPAQRAPGPEEDPMTSPSRPDLMLGGIAVGADHPPFVIAEMSGNHNGDKGRALEIVRAAAETGAHALKIQTYTADTITLDVDSPMFRLSPDHPLWPNRRLHDLYVEAHTPWEWHEEIFGLARELGMVPFSAPFDPTAVKFLDGLD